MSSHLTEETVRTLQGLAAGQRAVVGGLLGLDPAPRQEGPLDPRTRALVGLAALVAVNGAPPEHRAQVAAALEAGVTPEEIVEVLVAIAPHCGTARVVGAATSIASALGVDVGGGGPSPREIRPADRGEGAG